ncbi:MAG TPA: pyridoxamine 5'-phosphate oxidase family protein [Aggregatilineaceae bacterium]|nr:pyridoxamine 5'-phosphate oxidase family protein [Aggregatilineaceae bacterium]
MLDDAARAFLQKPLLARMSTIDQEGYPHTVPVWFMLEGDDICIIAVPETKKVGHIRRNPKGSVSVGGDVNDGGGYLIKGDFAVEDDPGGAFMRKITFHYEEPETAAKHVEDWKDLGIQTIRLKVKRVLKV